MKQSELDKILESHQKWLDFEGGQRANLSSVNLSNIDLGNSNLRRANLGNSNLRRADLSNSDLRGADLGNSNLRGADLSNSNLRRANLHGADLSNANLSDASLHGADLSNADLRSAKGIIRVGPSSDGYEFFGVVRDGVTWIKAGCRWFTVSDARKHWRETRGSTDLGKERLKFCDFIADWGRRNGAKK